MVTVPDVCQVSDPPLTPDNEGAVRSSLTVSVAPGVAGAHADWLPAPSTARNWPSVEPCAEIVGGGPEGADDHVCPPSVDVRYWYPASPEPPESVEPDAEMPTDATDCQARDPPLTMGAVGGVPSMRTVSDARGVAGIHAPGFPATSTARNWTSVSPSSLTVSDDPVLGQTHVVPPSIEVRYSSCEKPEPPVSAAVPALMVTDPDVRQVSDPPLTPDNVGAVRSIFTVSV